MSDQAAAANPDFRRKTLLTALAVPAIMLAAVWTMFLIKALFGIDVMTYVSQMEAMSVSTWLYLALGATPILIGYGWYAARKRLGLADHGVEVLGSVVSVGKIAQHGMLPVRYRYRYQNASYSGAMDLLEKDAQALGEAGRIRLIVNSRKPGQSDLYEHVFKS
jgi:hypothetical protein